MTNRGGIGVVGSPRFSSNNNGVGGSISNILPTAAAVGNRSVVLKLGVSPILGNAGPQMTNSMGNMLGGESIERSMSSGGGLSMPGLASRLNLASNSGSGNLSIRVPNRLISGVLQQASSQVISMLGNSYPIAGGPLSQSHVQLTSHPSFAGGSQGQLGSLRKQGLGVSTIVQQNQEFSIQNEDFLALPGFKCDNAGYAMDLYQKEQLHDNSKSMMQSQHFSMGRFAGFNSRGTKETGENDVQSWERSCANFKQTLDRMDEMLVQLDRMYRVSISTEMEVNQTEFVEDRGDQFGEKLMTEAIDEFHKLKQVGSVMEYQDRFEELRSLMLTLQPALTERYFVFNFIRGLKDELRSLVKMMMPATVKQAVEKARDQERALGAIFRKNGLQPNRSTKSSQQIEGASMAANQIEHESEENLDWDQPIVTKKSSKEERTSKAVGGNHSLYVQEVRDIPMKEISTEAEEGADAGKMLEEFFVERNKALAVLFIPLSVGELQRQIRLWPATKLEFLSMIGKDMVAAITDQLEPFSMGIRMRGMAGLAIAASHSINVFEENDTKRQKEKKTRDKHKKRRRRNQIARAGIG